MRFDVAQLAIDDGVAGRCVGPQNENAVQAVRGKQRRADVVAFEGPVHIDFAAHMLVGIVPESVVGQRGADLVSPALHCLGRVCFAVLYLLFVQLHAQIDQRQGDDYEQRSEHIDEAE